MSARVACGHWRTLPHDHTQGGPLKITHFRDMAVIVLSAAAGWERLAVTEHVLTAACADRGAPACKRWGGRGRAVHQTNLVCLGVCASKAPAIYAVPQTRAP